jgi:hypothetical protein
MRTQIESLYNKFYGQEVFIVAGGYSIKDINIDYLHDKNTIAINDSYKILPNATALFWCDTAWAGREHAGLKFHNTKLRFNPKFGGSGQIKSNIPTSGGALVLDRTGEYGYDPNIDNVMGNNGGVQCLNFVVNLGAKRIHLLGFDMRDNPIKRGETHWHDHHQLVVRHDTYSRLFIPSMDALDKGIRMAGVDVDIVNCSKNSAITCFRKEIMSELVKK